MSKKQGDARIILVMRKKHKVKINQTRFYLTLILALLCAASVIYIRQSNNSVVGIGKWILAYSDLSLILCAGIGGLESGLIAFVILAVAEFARVGLDYSGLYSVSIYLTLVLAAASFAYAGSFKTIRKSLLCALAFTLILMIGWKVNFSILLPSGGVNNVFYGRSTIEYFVAGFPESFIASLLLYLYFRFAPDLIKMQLGSGWVYTREGAKADRKNYVLNVRLSALSLVEALLICVMAVVTKNVFATQAAGQGLNWSFLVTNWKENLRMGILLMCMAVPVVYLLNEYIRIYIINPIDMMSMLMDRYFENEEERSSKKLPDLGIHTNDEIENLYNSLQKMVDDMGIYINRVLEMERKSTHLTEGFMLALAKSVDAKDHYTNGHSVRVAEYSREIARRMGKTEKEQQEIYAMGLLHDIGKIGVAESIINKNGRLNDEEFAQIKKHPVTGYEILKNVEELPGLATGARWHHERYDGKGYPDGKAGNDIPEEARIIAVADAYDAMTSNRAYSSIRPQEDVRREIERCRGSQFDPVIADVFLSMIDDDKQYQMREHPANDNKKTA